MGQAWASRPLTLLPAVDSCVLQTSSQAEAPEALDAQDLARDSRSPSPDKPGKPGKPSRRDPSSKPDPPGFSHAPGLAQW